MATTSGSVLPGAHVGGTLRLLLGAGLFVAAVALGLAIALANVPYFEFVNRFVGASDAVPRGLLFSSWLLLLGGPVVLWRPAAFGVQLGGLRHQWPAVAFTLTGAALATAVLLRATGTTPYSDASMFIEVVVVPITEELVFRGVLLTALLLAFARLFSPGSGVLLAVTANGMAFGAAHLANALDLPLTFVAAQVVFATVLGMGCAVLMLRTRSLYAAIVLHGVVNAVVVMV